MLSQSQAEEAFLDSQGRRKELVALRTHFYLSSDAQAQRLVNKEVVERIQAEQETVEFDPKFNSSALRVSMTRRSFSRPLYVLKMRKRIHKRTKQVLYRVEECQVVRHLYEYEGMGDFVSSEACSELPGNTSNYELQPEPLLEFVKESFNKRIERRKNGQQILKQEQAEQMRRFIRPQNYLKSFNLAPPKCDFFNNKLKGKEDRLVSVAINYEDPVPLEYHSNVPQFYQQSELWKVLQRYLLRRPCWLRNALVATLRQENISFTSNELKNTIRYLCFTFKNGPWKHVFCKFGYDPKASYKAVVYQNMTLKLKKKEAEDYEQENQDQLYDPTFQESPSRCIGSYQLGDICVEGVQQVLNGKLISQDGQCSRQHGWLTPTEHSHILKLMKEFRDVQGNTKSRQVI